MKGIFFVPQEARWEYIKNSAASPEIGKIVAEGSEDKDELVTADLDLDQIQEVRDKWQFFRDRRPETYEDMTKLLP